MIHSFLFIFTLKSFITYIHCTWTFKNHFKRFKNFYLYICVCVHVGVCHLCVGAQEARRTGLDSPVAGMTNHCEPPQVGAGNEIQTF